MIKKTINIIGSSGSIGCSAFEVLKNNLDKFEINIILGFQNWRLILEQSLILKPKFIFISKDHIVKIQERIEKNIKVFPVEDFEEIIKSINFVSDITLLSVKGFIGLKFCLDLIQFSKRICLANKESIICGGHIILNEFKKYNCELIPVDSEHNTIFQIIENLKNKDQIDEIIITASGGPFLSQIRSGKLNELRDISFKEAADHPRWKMGVEISINSATLMNKAQELIEAFYLFGIKKISAIIHPEHFVHGIVNLKNGMSFMGASYPDMKIHIAHSLFLDSGKENSFKFLNLKLAEIKNLNFFEIIDWPFDFINLAFEIIQNEDLRKSIIMNALNEIALGFFIKKKLGFLEINDFILKNLEKFSLINQPLNSKEIFEIDRLVRGEFITD